MSNNFGEKLKAKNEKRGMPLVKKKNSLFFAFRFEL